MGEGVRGGREEGDGARNWRKRAEQVSKQIECDAHLVNGDGELLRDCAGLFAAHRALLLHLAAALLLVTSAIGGLLGVA